MRAVFCCTNLVGGLWPNTQILVLSVPTQARVIAVPYSFFVFLVGGVHLYPSITLLFALRSACWPTHGREKTGKRSQQGCKEALMQYLGTARWQTDSRPDLRTVKLRAYGPCVWVSERFPEPFRHLRLVWFEKYTAASKSSNRSPLSFRPMEKNLWVRPQNECSKLVRFK